MASTNIICFGQQPNGFFPKGFFINKILTARELQKQIGGTIVWFCHDSDHDYRETVTKIKTNRYPEGFVRLNINQTSKFQKLFSPLYVKDIKPGWQEETANKLEPIVTKEAWEMFRSIRITHHSRHAEPVEASPTNVGSHARGIPRQARNDIEKVATVADFCIAMYRAIGWLDGIDVIRSSDPGFRTQAIDISAQDHYLDTEYNGIIVHARKSDQGYYLDHGGNVKEYIPVNVLAKHASPLPPEKLSPTRTNRFPWMESVIHCTHYVYGKGEQEYVAFTPWKDITFIPRKEIHDPEFAVMTPGNI